MREFVCEKKLFRVWVVKINAFSYENEEFIVMFIGIEIKFNEKFEIRFEIWIWSEKWFKFLKFVIFWFFTHKIQRFLKVFMGISVDFTKFSSKSHS